jgi:hypothetical protein
MLLSERRANSATHYAYQFPLRKHSLLLESFARAQHRRRERIRFNVDGAGEGIRTPASTKPTGYLAFRLLALFSTILEASAITTPPPRHTNTELCMPAKNVLGLKLAVGILVVNF